MGEVVDPAHCEGARGGLGLGDSPPGTLQGEIALSGLLSGPEPSLDGRRAWASVLL